MEKIQEYSEKIAKQLSGIFDKENPNYITYEDLESPENFEAFMFALGTSVPLGVLNKATNQELGMLAFNHLQNLTIFKYVSTTPPEQIQ